MGHTPIIFDGNCGGYLEQDGAKIARAYSHDDARRFAATWNATADFTTEALEQGVVRELVEAALAVIKSRDDNCFDREEFKQSANYGNYWSPAASMVDSEAIAGLRNVLAKIGAK